MARRKRAGWKRAQRARLAGVAGAHADDFGLPAASSLTPSCRHFMLLWNRFARHHPLSSDYITSTRCEQFVTSREGREIAASPDFAELRAAFSQHLAALWRHALLQPATLAGCLGSLDRLRAEHLEQQQRQQGR
ncbi:hypothetical protein Agub_g7775 [Astrephomene gubernaculifera]|uniref:Polycomb protein VEFS-Box domain-containing protein n=1 Tax=Astrephomene gubernaculifera TaxID=47775 RepID=A0AAD3DQJ7_9CHLO|nr:hypothetical protein Agub_g7775 [Astrephomene gubernaculifera]